MLLTWNFKTELAGQYLLLLEQNSLMSMMKVVASLWMRLMMELDDSRALLMYLLTVGWLVVS